MKEEKEVSAFDILAQQLSSPIIPELSPEEEAIINRQNTRNTSDEDEELSEDETEQVEEIEEEVSEVEEDEEELPKEEEETKKEIKKPAKKQETEKTETGETLDEYEEDISKYVKDKLETKLGVSLKDVSSVGEIVDELASMVEESTKDVFASEEIERLNEFVRSGGDLKKFYGEVYAGVDPENVDVENVSDQKKIIKETLKLRGYDDKRIDRIVSRYEDSGVLQEEAEDALDDLKSSVDKKKKELLETQQKIANESKKRNEKFINDVQKSIKELKDIRGIAISDKEKKDLYQYIFMPEADGLTRYQKDYSSSAKNLIESAFLTMKGDTLIQRALKQGATSTAKTLKDKLSQKARVKKTGSREDGGPSALDMFAAVLGK